MRKAELSEAKGFLLLFIVFKLAVIGVSAFIMYLGYKLFILGVTGSITIVVGSDVLSAKLINASPGVIVFIGGFIILCIIAKKGLPIDYSFIKRDKDYLHKLHRIQHEMKDEVYRSKDSNKDSGRN